MTPLERIRLEKAAADCGFERTPELTDDGGLALRSTQFPEVVWLHSLGLRGFQVKASHPALVNDAPDATVQAANIEKLYTVLNHAAATARTLPNRVADAFRQQTAKMPTTTEAERLVVQRVGQNLFRESVASGNPQTGAPDSNGIGQVMQCYLEASNVNVVEELVMMIQTQRAYEMNSKAISTSDQMLAKLNQI